MSTTTRPCALAHDVTQCTPSCRQWVPANPFVPTWEAPYFLEALNEIAFVTATIADEAGGRWVLVSRNARVTMVDSATGRTLLGTHVHILNGRLWLRDNNADLTLLRTARLVTIDVHEN